MDPWTSWNLDLRARERTQCRTQAHADAHVFLASTCIPSAYIYVCVYVCVYARVRARIRKRYRPCSEQTSRAHARPSGWRMSANRHRRGRVHSAEILSPILFLDEYIPCPLTDAQSGGLGDSGERPNGTLVKDARACDTSALH